MLLPWGESTVLQTVISTLHSARIEQILVITGGAREQVEALIGDSARACFNLKYQEGGMLSSLQLGLSEMEAEAEAMLICLGDQPQIQKGTVRDVCDAHRGNESNIIVPSYQMRRGHPWLVPQNYWEEIRKMKAPSTMRDFLSEHAKQIHYVKVDTPSIIADLDTKEDYLRSKP